MTVRESKVEAHLVKRAKALGFMVRKVKFLGVDGAPDRVLFAPERLRMLGHTTYWIELKAPGEKPRMRQEREHKAMREHGQHVTVLDSIEAVDRFFEQFQ